MAKAIQTTGIDLQLQEQLFSLVMDAIAPWVFPDGFFDEQKRVLENWSIASISMENDQVCMCVMQTNSNVKYTALICCLGEPEIVAVSYTDGNPGMLNPYLDSDYKLETDLDGLACWNVLSITFRAEPGAETIRFLRDGVMIEVDINEFGCFSYTDWNSSRPVEKYLAVKVRGKWQELLIESIPYTVEYMAARWRLAIIDNNKNMHKWWNDWISAAFVELCGYDRMVLSREMTKVFVGEENETCYQAFKNEQQKFINREEELLKQPVFK